MCGVPQSPGGSQLHVMVSISLVHIAGKKVSVCLSMCVCGCVLFRVEVRITKGRLLFLNRDDSVVLLYCNSVRRRRMCLTNAGSRSLI